MIVEPTKENLLWRQAQELLQSFILIQKPIKLRVEFDINLSKKTTADDLPDET